MNALANYVTPVSVDHAGQFPYKKPGEKFELAYKGRLFSVEVQDTSPIMLPNGSILRDMRFQQVEGPVTRWDSFSQ